MPNGRVDPPPWTAAADAYSASWFRIVSDPTVYKHVAAEPWHPAGVPPCTCLSHAFAHLYRCYFPSGWPGARSTEGNRREAWSKDVPYHRFFARFGWSGPIGREQPYAPCASSTWGGDPCPDRWPRWTPRGEFAPPSASTGIGEHRGGLVMNQTGKDAMDRIEWFAGVDWGSEIHHVCIIDVERRVQGERSFEHTGLGLAELAAWLLQQAGVASDVIAVALEVPHGPVVEALMERGFVVHSLNPKQLDRFGDRFSPAGAKDDRRDARVLADALRTDRRLDPVEPEVVELREWTRIADELTTEQTRLANRVRQQLWRYYPQILTVDGDPAKAWVLDLWQLAPTPDKARRVRKDTVARLLKRHRVRCIDAEEVLRRLREPTIPVAPGTAEAAVAHIDTVAERLALVRRQLVQAHAKMERLTKALATAMENPHDAPGIQAQRDVAILASLPGVGKIVLATLLAEAFDPLRRRDTTPCVACAAPPQSPGARARARSSSADWPLTIACATPSITGHASLCSAIRSAKPSMPPSSPRPWPWPRPAVRRRPVDRRRLRHARKPNPLCTRSSQATPCSLRIHASIRRTQAAEGTLQMVGSPPPDRMQLLGNGQQGRLQSTAIRDDRPVLKLQSRALTP